MVDVVSTEDRSRMMAGIRGTNTRPELQVRSALFARGYRFRLHDVRLPGRPDLVLPMHRAVIFVNGCFWHGHGCHLFKWPDNNADFWRQKIERTREVDERARGELLRQDWRVLTVWECGLRTRDHEVACRLFDRVDEWLKGDAQELEIDARSMKTTGST